MFKPGLKGMLLLSPGLLSDASSLFPSPLELPLLVHASAAADDFMQMLLVTFWAADVDGFQHSFSRCAFLTLSIWSWPRCCAGVRQQSQATLEQ